MTKKDVLEPIIIAVIVAVVSFISGYSFGRNSVKQTSNTTPIKEMTRVDTIRIENEVIKYKIQYIDSVRHEKVREVRSLDDSATIKLFIELCTK